MCATITGETIRHLAALTRIAVRPEETERLAADLASVLRYMDRLAKYDTSDVLPWRPTDPWPPARIGSVVPPASADSEPPADWRPDVPAEPLPPTALTITGGEHFNVKTGLFDAPAVR